MILSLVKHFLCLMNDYFVNCHLIEKNHILYNFQQKKVGINNNKIILK